ncbi:hypothetical protein Gogos_006010 [Gossypium gossypioides]|uniref:Zinc knuckle CX2CX4HX4C domain-containing protein n=1 Tax=Gossypium gossypioides TaxID=34282 RepID=A0A7J9C4G0_GOSGO|nr:hypothetical protein [Gossypium gossypioides]
MVNLNSLCDSNGEGDSPPDDPSTKQYGVSGVEHADREFSLLQGDVKKSVVNGIPLIEFLKRIHQLLVNKMSISVVFKLLGRNIGVRGWYARVAVYANLDKPLILKVIINENIQRIEYESLPLVCFSYGSYGHNKDSCLHSLKTLASLEEVVSSAETILENTAVKKGEFDPWMLVERRTKRTSWELNKLRKSRFEEKSSRSRFNASRSSWVSFAESMKMVVDLISSELDGLAIKNLPKKEREPLDNVVTSR